MFIVHLCLLGVVIKRMEWTFLARWWVWLHRDNSTLMKGPPAPVQNTSQCLFLGYEGRSADTVWRNNRSIEKRPLEDAVPIEHGAFPLPSSLPSLPESSHPLRSEPFLFPPSHINSLIFISIYLDRFTDVYYLPKRWSMDIFPTYQNDRIWPMYRWPTSAGTLPKKRHCKKRGPLRLLRLLRLSRLVRLLREMPELL